MATKPKNDEVATVEGSEAEYSNLSYEQLMQLLDSDDIVHLRDLDDTEVIEKANLVGVPFVITEWVRKASQGMGDYIVVRAKTANDNSVVFADGSTGIMEQLLRFDVVGKPILCPHGLRASNYMTEDDQGNKISATTYYLDTAK